MGKGRPCIDITGLKFGHLTVIKREIPNDSHNRSRWLCKCDCGNETIVRGSNLKSGNTKSCGKCEFSYKGPKLEKTEFEGVYAYTHYVTVKNVNGNKVYLGDFDTLEEALNAKIRYEHSQSKQFS